VADPRYSDDDLLGALRAAAAAEGQPLSVTAYARHQQAHGGPASARVIQRLGSWNEALVAAGLQTRAGHGSPARRWSEAPSAQTVRNAFGSWSAAVAAAREDQAGSAPTEDASSSRTRGMTSSP
jgi:D-serine deaminase-like pyridoxal phosphate-dependent protein